MTTFGDDKSVEGSTKSRHSSMWGPYRKGMDDPDTFAYCQLIKNADTTPDHFSSSLLSAGQGFPIWDPKGNLIRPAAHLRNCISIGDVLRQGWDGSYNYYFNIFKPASHPIQNHYVPPNLEPYPIPLEELEICKETLPPGTVIASHGVKVTRISDSPLEIHMTSAAREGAVLVLPEGASREDIAEPQKLYKYARDQMTDWYRHLRLEASPTDDIANGAMYLITGVDRPLQGALEWAIFPAPNTTTGATDIRYLSHAPRKLTLEFTKNVESDVLALERQNRVDSVSVIVRGMKLALPPTLWPQIPMYHPEARMYYQILSTPVLGWHARLLQCRDRLFGVPTNPRIDGAKIPFHPSEIICQILLEKVVMRPRVVGDVSDKIQSPSARVAIVEDRVWMAAVLDEPCTLPKIRGLLLRVFAMHEMVTKDGIAYLVPRSGNDMIRQNKGLVRLPFSEAFPGKHFVKKRLRDILKTRID